MKSIYIFQGRLFPHPNKATVHKIPGFLRPGSMLPIQSSTVWSIHSSNGIHNGRLRSQTDCSKQSPPVPIDNWMVRTTSHQTCLHHTQMSTQVAMCQELGYTVNMEKSELEPKQVFDFASCQFDPKEGKV